MVRMAYLLRKYIPEDILNYHIIPYTYLPQSAQLQKDVKTYVFTYKKLSAYYAERWSMGAFRSVMMFDLMKYYGQFVLKAPEFSVACEVRLVEEYLHDPPEGEIKVGILFRKLLTGESVYGIRILWGRMTPLDRLKFMVAKMGLQAS